MQPVGCVTLKGIYASGGSLLRRRPAPLPSTSRIAMLACDDPTFSTPAVSTKFPSHFLIWNFLAFAVPGFQLLFASIRNPELWC